MSVKSAKRVIDVFEILMKYPKGLLSKEISEILEIPQSSTFNLLSTLVKFNYLSRDSYKRYRLGPKLIPLGRSAMQFLDIHEISLPHLKGLCEKVRETVFMAVLSDDELVYIAKEVSDRSIQTAAQPGMKKPLYCTGLGKIFLAFLSFEERKEILDHIDLVPYTEKTIVNRNELEKQLDQYYSDGYSIDDEENEEGLFCIAAPIFGANNSMIAAISVAGPKERVYTKKDFIVKEIKHTASQISAEMGYN